MPLGIPFYLRNDMSKTNETTRWVNKTVQMLCNEFKVTARIVIANHIKVYFTNSQGKSCLCVLSKSTGDKNARHIEIGLIRRELRNKLDVDVDRECFHMQLQPSSGFIF
jgi:hypothetical protein